MFEIVKVWYIYISFYLLKIVRKKLKSFYKYNEAFHKNKIGFPSDHVIIADGLHLHFHLTIPNKIVLMLNRLFVTLIRLKFYKTNLKIIWWKLILSFKIRAEMSRIESFSIYLSLPNEFFHPTYVYCFDYQKKT